MPEQDVMRHLEVIEARVSECHGDVIRLQEQVAAANRERNVVEKRLDKHGDRITAIEKLVWRGGGALAAFVVIAQFVSSWLKMNGG